MLVQDFLRNGGTLAQLAERYSISAKRHRQYGNLVLLKYNQIDSPMAEPIVRECRGVILDEADNWRAVSRAMDKFGNYGESYAAQIDWTTARVQEKLDGSLISCYTYNGEWHVATSGTPDAGGEVNGADYTFRDYFWTTFRARGGQLPDIMGEYCFFFELTGPANRIVVVHSEPRVTLLGGRYLSGEMPEMTPSEARMLLGYTVPTVQEFPLQSFEDIAASFASMSPLKQEGYVVVDAAFRRVKVKSPAYLALHHAKDSFSPKAFVEIARAGETSEVLTAFPEFKPMMDTATSRLVALCTEVQDDYLRLAHHTDQKSFAIEAVKTKYSAALFDMRRGRARSARDFFAGYQIDRLMQMLGY